MEVYQVIWWNGFVRDMVSPFEKREAQPEEDEALEEREFSTAEQAVRFMDRENCRRYGELFPEAPCFCSMHSHRGKHAYFLQAIPYREAVEKVLETKEVTRR